MSFMRNHDAARRSAEGPWPGLGRKRRAMERTKDSWTASMKNARPSQTPTAPRNEDDRITSL